MSDRERERQRIVRSARRGRRAAVVMFVVALCAVVAFAVLGPLWAVASAACSAIAAALSWWSFGATLELMEPRRFRL